MKTKPLHSELILPLLIILGLCPGSLFSQQLVINEVSQGPSGTKEYVEFVVMGTPSCTSTVCMDLRNVIIDDNNGTFASGSGTGIASGCLRFKNDPFWACIPIGTLILIYNDADMNALVPAADLSMSDGNCKLIIPVSNCTLLEKNTSTPSTSIPAFPATGFSACGSWNSVGMSNSDDSFQTISSTGTLMHAVSWGNNNNSTIIYFSGSASAKVAVMENTVDNNPANQANWAMLAVSGNETPGSANNAANQAWLNSMNNSCTPFVPMTMTVTGTNAGCTCSGSATVAVSGGTGPFTYTWSPAGGNSATASGLCAGVYTVSASSTSGCFETATVSIGASSGFSLNITAFNEPCHGMFAGSASVAPAGGTGPFSYTWTPGNTHASSIQNVQAGTYSVTVADAAGCQQTGSVTITEPAALTATFNALPASCFGSSTGSINVMAAGGTGAYTYSWTPASSGTLSGGNINGLPAGAYTVTVRDANTCGVVGNVVINQPPATTLSIASADATCGLANGSATVSASGGSGAYTFTWTPGNAQGSTISGLAPGAYTVNASDANNCPSTATGTVNAVGTISLSVLSTSVSCFGGSDGTATANATGAPSPLSYTWTAGGANTPAITGLTAGVYTVTASNAIGCTDTKTVSVIQPTALSLSVSSTSITCNGASNGSATVSASGGLPAYTYTWSSAGGHAATASGLAPGSYTVQVSDQNNCIQSSTVSIGQPAAISASVSVTNVMCGTPGSATVAASGGTGALSYAWSPLGGTGMVAGSLPAGTYTTTVTDQNLCQLAVTSTITAPGGYTTTVSSGSVSCFGGSDGVASATVTGSSGPYSYTWSPSATMAATALNLTAGTYTLHVLDVNGCPDTKTVTVAQPNPLNIGVNNIQVCKGQQANVPAVVGGGTVPYTYSWSPGGGNGPSLAATPSVTTIYTVSISDSHGCGPVNAAVTVSVLPALSVSVSGPTTACNGSQVSLTANVSGGNGNYQYLWQPGSQHSQSIQQQITANTIFTVTVSDGCTVQSGQATASVNVLQIPVINISNTGIASCPPLCTSFYDSTLIASGIITSWQWHFSNGQSSSVPSPQVCFTAEGSYTGTLVVQTANGCQIAPSVVSGIQVYPLPVADFTSNTYTVTLTDPLFELSNNSTNTDSVWWQANGQVYTGNTLPLTYDNEGIYPVKLTAINHYGCIDSITKVLTVKPDFTFYAPNAFTPNGDTRNELFLPLGLGWKTGTYELLVFDRWGNLAFRSTDPNKGWDGRKGGSLMAPEDIYVWKVELDDIFNKHHSMMGHVTLLN